jgi:CRISPR-associated protein Csb2
MVRHAVADLARQMRPFGWTDADINTFVHGHTPDGQRPAHGPDAGRRFAYLPLPSLERRGGASLVVTALRRILVVGPPGFERQVAWVQVLSGHELTPVDEQTPPASLRIIEKPLVLLRADPNLRPYLGTSAVWSTVTPVVLPGFDDGEPGKTERLLRKALEQAGVPAELVGAASLEWRRVGFWAGVELATRYRLPESIPFPRYHVRVRWPAPVQGPLAVGAGRYRGLGVFAIEGVG